MGTPDRPRILVVEDNVHVRQFLEDQLTELGYRITAAASGEEALAALDRETIDLVITDIHMPGMSGIDLCRQIKSDARFEFMPVILLTAVSELDARVAGLAAGADDFFAKPVSSVELRTRMAALLQLKSLIDANKRLYETVQAQAIELAENQRTLEHRVQEQLGELERLGRLKRFLAPEIADLIVTGRAEDPLRTHRSEITVVFVDMRGFTSFTETSEPEEVMAVLNEYRVEMGRLIVQHQGTLERYTGDGMMILFNDPLPVPDAPARAIRMALAMREREQALSVKWHRRGFELNFGFGISQGYATIGKIGFDDRWDYTAIGSVVNLAARLCGVAQAGQIVVPERVVWAVDDLVEAEAIGTFELKGFKRPVRTYNVVRMRA